MKNIYFLIILLFVIGCKSSHNNFTANNQAVVLQFKEDSLIRKEFNRISPEYKFNDLFKTECAKFYKGDNLIEICAFNDQDSTYQKSNFVIVKLINSEVQISDTIFMEQPVYVSSLNLSVDVYNDYFFIAWVTENTQTYIPSTINIKCFNIKTKEKIFQHIVYEQTWGIMFLSVIYNPFTNSVLFAYNDYNEKGSSSLFYGSLQFNYLLSQNPKLKPFSILKYEKTDKSNPHFIRTKQKMFLYHSAGGKYGMFANNRQGGVGFSIISKQNVPKVYRTISDKRTVNNKLIIISDTVYYQHVIGVYDEDYEIKKIAVKDIEVFE